MLFESLALTPVLHHYAPRLVAIEYQPAPHHSHVKPHNLILFIGGLGDGIRTVKYPYRLHNYLQDRGHFTWTVAELLLGSSYAGWTTSTLDKDCDDVAKAVAYFRSLQASSGRGGRIILMGHSTGGQIATHYCVGPWQARSIPPDTLLRPLIDGVILQAAVSDREGIASTSLDVAASLAVARKMVHERRPLDHMPSASTNGLYGAQPSAQRWLSLASTEPDEAYDDYFSSDLSNQRVQRIWGVGGLAKRMMPVMVLQSGLDGSIPKHVDKTELVKKWGQAVKDAGGIWSPQSGVISGAGHNLNDSPGEAVMDLCRRVESFITTTLPCSRGKAMV